MQAKVIIFVFGLLVLVGCVGQQELSSDGSGTASFTGTWESEWGQLVLLQEGDTVTGSYTHDNGKIKGNVHGNVLKGTWSEAPSYSAPQDAGDFEFVLTSDGKSWLGKWRYGSCGDWRTDWSASLLAK